MTIRVIVAHEFCGHLPGEEIELESYRAKIAVRSGVAVFACDDADGVHNAGSSAPNIPGESVEEAQSRGRLDRDGRASRQALVRAGAAVGYDRSRPRQTTAAMVARRVGGRRRWQPGPYASAPEWWPDWRGQACVIVASGPSAQDAGVERARGRARFLTINNSWQLATWADAHYATDHRWWEKFHGLPEFAGLKICQDPKISTRPEWGVQKVEVSKLNDQLQLAKVGVIGWGGNSGFGALNLAVQFGANPIVLVGYDMRLDRGVHWHGLHGGGLTNPHARNVERWRRCVDGCAPLLNGLGIRVFNASPVSWLQNYPKMDLMDALNERADRDAA